MRVLVVDDSRVMRQIVVRALRQAGLNGLEVLEAPDGRAGLGAVADERPDLVLCDWNMPEMSGIEMLEALRASGDRTTFGFVTSEASDEIRDRALRGGADFVVTKPFTPESLGDAIAAVAA